MAELSQAANTLSERRPEIREKVPFRNKNFTGRDDLLLRLRQNISTVTAVVPQPHALHGLGGVGKTHLAIEYAHRYRTHYDLVWWIPADQRVLVPSALAAMAPHLGLPSAATTGVEEAAEAVRRALQSGKPYRRWLLIFDNAEEPAAIEEFIPRGPGHVLITSRNPKWEDYNFETLSIDVFTREESLAFLRRRLRGNIDDAEADRLAEKLGDLPLALEQAGALQYETGMAIGEYIELLDEQAGQLLNVNRAADYPMTMTAAWRVSVAQLQDHLPEAIEILRVCAFFGAEPIPRDVFRRSANALTPRLSGILSNPILLTKCLRALRRFALARIEPETRTIQVHRLIQKLLRDDLSEQEQHDMRHEVHLRLAGYAPTDPDNTDRWRNFDELVAHVVPSGVPDCTDPRVREFALNTVRYLYTSGNYQSAREFVTDMIGKWTAVSGAKHPETLVARTHLGNVLRGLGEYAAAYELDHANLQDMRNVFGAERSETLWATNAYGATLRTRGEFDAARRSDERALADHERVFGPSHAGTLRVRNSLGLDYALTSDYDRAKRVHEDNLVKLSTTTEGVSKSLVLLAWNNLARAVRLCGDFEEACDVGQEAYEYGVQELTVDHHSTLLAAKDLAIARRAFGELDEALQLAEETYTRIKRLLRTPSRRSRGRGQPVQHPAHGRPGRRRADRRGGGGPPLPRRVRRPPPLHRRLHQQPRHPPPPARGRRHRGGAEREGADQPDRPAGSRPRLHPHLRHQPQQ